MKKALLINLWILLILVCTQTVLGYGFEKKISENYIYHPLIHQLTDTTFIMTSHIDIDDSFSVEGDAYFKIFDIDGNLLYENDNITFTPYTYLLKWYYTFIIVIPNSHFLFFWYYENPNNYDYIDYYVQQFSTEGDKSGDPVFINPNLGGWGNMGSTRIIKSSDNSIFFIWHAWEKHSRIQIQHLSPTGEKIGNAKFLNQYGIESVIKLKNDNLAIFDYVNYPYFSLFSPQTEQIIQKYNGGLGWFEKAFALENGNFIIIYEKYINNTKGMFCDFFSDQGERLTESIKINNLSTYIDYTHILDYVDELFFAWISNKDENGYRDYYLNICRIKQSGEKYQQKIDMNSYEYLGKLTNLIKTSDDRVIMVWNSNNINYAQYYNLNDNTLGEKFKINSLQKNCLPVHAELILADGSFILFYGKRGDTNHNYMKRFKNEPQYHTLKPFQVTGPAHDQSINITNPTFIWTQPSDSMVSYPFELKYEVYLSESPDFTDPVINKIDGDTSLTIRNLTPGTTYFWQVKATNLNDEEIWSDNVNAFFVRESASTGIEDDSETPYKYELMNNYPNPFNGTTTLSYTLQNPGHVNITLYNMMGQKVATLVDGYQIAQQNAIKWNGTNDFGEPVSSGIYFARMQTGDYTQTIKMAFVE